MKQFLDVDTLSAQDIHDLLERAFWFKKNTVYPQDPQTIVAHLFYEPSTRTRVSFELAAQHLGLKIINVDVHTSSETKGEVMDDTINTLQAMGVNVVVIRHQQDGVPALIAKRHPSLGLINAGDGMHAHPTQALLDLMTIVACKPDVNALKIVIIGDVRHSRVAHSWSRLVTTLGLNPLVCVAPGAWQPSQSNVGVVTTSLSEGVCDADVVMCLRVQKERFTPDEPMDLVAYQRDYQLTPERLACAKRDVMVMHPGPMNRGIEISSAVADGAHSHILQQVRHGVYMRMAILERVIHAL